MRIAAVVAVLICGVAGRADAQAISFPADADMRAMQAPSDWQGSRAQHVQGDDPPIAAPITLQSLLPQSLAPVTRDTAHPDYTVEVWDDHDQLVETMARCSDLLVGQAAFKAAAKERQGLKVTLSQGGTVVATKAPGQVASR